MKLSFITEIKALLESASERVRTSINIAMVYTYYEIGKRIVEEEQKGKNRAEYGRRILEILSKELTKDYGRGYSISNLRTIRQFYSVYSKNQIRQPVVGESKTLGVLCGTGNLEQRSKKLFVDFPITSDGNQFVLSWTMYVILLRIKDSLERRFYEIEAYNSSWSKRELQRQIDSCLYERLLLSGDKDMALELSKKGQIIEKAKDAIKDPLILNFLDLDEKPVYTEKEFETKIIDKLQDFLLELGKGFMFYRRQMRISFEDKHFYPDLVFYHRYLRCFVIVDLKIGSLKHQDIGQMQMYVNYFDRHIKENNENKTIGILICKEKDDAMVEMTLPEDNGQIFTSRYETVLPSKEELRKLLLEKY